MLGVGLRGYSLIANCGKYLSLLLYVGFHSNVHLCISNPLTLEEDLKECMPKLVHAIWLRGLINVVSKAVVRGKFEKYCIGNFAMDMFIGLLQRRQQTYPKLCWLSVFLKHHTSVILHNKVHISGKEWDSIKSAPHADLCYLMDLHRRYFFVYDSLLSAEDKNRPALLVNICACCYVRLVMVGYVVMVSQWT
ncbi:LOW QUALITY PROTEIN: hypothetical protein Cgig2_025779 [Carnegiea gigantea]|uniref:Uncharacterized protein n=1 Tax=Carnegiea gigantea TaxID=171969 RepID=A0A9Q1JGX3_9CARY|nr:LOW QUALITY PROTEIN: hypothetical protein Cgig2_025779 [Carnegiea gigantea]